MRANEPLVVFDVFDGEVMAVRNDTGTYYSMQGTAALAFQALAAGQEVEQVTRLLAEAHDHPPEQVQADVEAFVLQLRAQQLVDDGEPASGTAEPARPSAPGPYAPPVLESFTDMQDLLLFDPIHEVEPAGWPKVDPAEPA